VTQRVFEVGQAFLSSLETQRALLMLVPSNTASAVLVHQAAGHHLELQHADRAQYQLAALHRLEDLHRALFAQLLQALCSCLIFSGFGCARRKKSGAKNGMPVKVSISPSENESPICILPWFGKPMMSPA
jgi:hypothetical protein